jgi:ribonuclease P protein component
MPQSICLDRDIDELFKARQSLVRRGRDCRQLSAMWLLRDAPATLLTPLLILFIIPKRYIRNSHERHKIQRWLREAIRCSPKTIEIEGLLQTINKEALLGIRCQLAPSKDLNWKVISSDIEIVLEHLLKAIERS